MDAVEPQNRKHLLLKNGVYSALSWLLPLILGLIVTPIIVRTLGNELYGLYAVILGFISYSFTFGIGKTAAKYVAEYRSSGQPEKISETISAILWISMTFGVLAIVVVGLSAPYIVANVLLITPDLQDTAVSALYLAGGTILFIMLSQVFQFVLQGVHRFDRYLLLTNLSGLLLNLGSVALVLAGYGVLALLIWNLFLTVFIGVLFYINARRLLPEFDLRIGIKAEFWRVALKYSLSIIAYQICGNLLLLFERGWIVRTFNAETLTFYVVPMALCFYFHAFISSLIIVMFPVVNELLADRERLVRLYQTSTKLILALTALFVVSSIITGKAFLTIWMSSEFAEFSYPLLVIHSCTFAVITVTMIAWQMTESFRAAAVNALASVVWISISIPLMIVFSQYWQSAGVGLARLVGVCSFLGLILYVEKKFLGGISLRFWSATIFKLAGAAAVCAMIQWLVMRSFEPGWIAVAASGTASLIGYLAALFVAGYFGEAEKQGLKRIAARLRRFW